MWTKPATIAAAALLAACGSMGTTSEELAGGDPAPATSGRMGQVARVMTRNLYLGADLSPVIGAPSLPAFVAGAGGVLRQVSATDFPARAHGLAAEIIAAQPDLVGLQEVALWRTGPASIAPLLGAPPSASTVRFDYLQLLLDELAAGGARYAPVAIEEEFDFEAPADENGVAGDGPAPIGNAELNARLTMRDVILARVEGGGVKVSNPIAGHYAHLLVLPILGKGLAVTRGWVRVDARVRGSLPFRFVATHFEAFDPRTVHPSVRAQQAAELAAGPAAPADVPVVVVGDLNSDDDTVVLDDQQAYRALLDAGFVERSTGDPLSCCVESYDLTTGTVAEFDHQVDHVMTDSPDDVRLLDAFVTGRAMVDGRWDSDHAGVVSALRIH